jgi:hypothetical protein
MSPDQTRRGRQGHDPFVNHGPPPQPQHAIDNECTAYDQTALDMLLDPWSVNTAYNQTALDTLLDLWSVNNSAYSYMSGGYNAHDNYQMMRGDPRLMMPPPPPVSTSGYTTGRSTSSRNDRSSSTSVSEDCIPSSQIQTLGDYADTALVDGSVTKMNTGDGTEIVAGSNSTDLVRATDRNALPVQTRATAATTINIEVDLQNTCHT